MKRRKSGVLVPDEPATVSTPHATLALFAYADVKPDTVDCLLRDARLWPNLVYARISNDALISRSRSRIASDFLQSKRELVGDVLLMLDHDMKWELGDLVYLAEKTLETKAVIAGVYPKRAFGGGTAVRFGTTGRYTIGEDVLAPAMYVSTGFIGIHREVLEKMAETMPCTIGNFWPFFLPVLADHPIDKDACEYLSEDWAFCARARALGVPIYAAMKPRLAHVGEHTYRMIDSQATPPPDRNISFDIRGEVEVPAIRWLFKDAAEYTGVAPDQMHKVIATARDGLCKLWYGHGSADPKVENMWHRREDVGRHYVLDLVGTHSSDTGLLIVENLKDVKDKRVLDFGSGIGTIALMLAMQGNQVDCVEINKELTKFANFRFARHLEGKPVPRHVSSPDGEYDMAIAFHVFEHLPDPEARLQELVGALKPGGLVFTQSTFQADAGHPMNHERADWDERMAEAGLVRTGTDWFTKPAASLVRTCDGFEMYVDPDDTVVSASLAQCGAWDPEVAEVVRKRLKPDWTFLDLGAHIGYFTVLAAKRCKRVIAVEPAPMAFNLLEANAKLNKLNNVEAHKVAVSDKTGPVGLVLTRGNTGETYTSEVNGAIPVDGIRLDELLDGWPEFIKIDIEGDEKKVLASCPELLANAKVIVSEFSEAQLQRGSGCSVGEYERFLRDAGFEVTILHRKPTYGDLLAVKV